LGSRRCENSLSQLAVEHKHSTRRLLHHFKLLNDLVDLAIKEKDHASNTFLQWFVNEQVEEEASADQVVQQLIMMEKAPGGMFMLDRELAQRVFTPPATKGA
jgi:ferritin